MNTCYLDSNFLIYLKDEDSPNHEAAYQKLRSLTEQTVEFYISPLVLDEAIYAIKYRLIRKNQKDVFTRLKNTIREILQIPTLHIVNPPDTLEAQIEVIDLMKEYQLNCRDAYHLLTIKANKIDGFATFDTDFAKVFADKIVRDVTDKSKKIS